VYVLVVHVFLMRSKVDKIQTRLVAPLHVAVESREKIKLETVDSHATITADISKRWIKLRRRQRLRNHCNAHDVDSVLVVMQKYWLQ
jgi:hypothetical protein